MILAAVGFAVWWFLGEMRALESPAGIEVNPVQTINKQEQTVEGDDSPQAIEKDLSDIEDIDLDKEFKEIDADLQNL